MLPRFAYERPTTLADAVGRLEEEGALLHAGGTDLLGCLRDGVVQAGTVVSLAGVGELRGIRELADGGVGIGATSTLTEVAEHPTVVARFPALARAAAAVGSPQLRNQGTLGGNLCQKPRCWYYRGPFLCARKGGDRCFAAEGENQYHCIFGGDTCFYVHPSDTAPALVAAGALLRLVGPAGQRTVPVASFFVLPQEDFTRETVLERGEMVREVLLPPPLPGSRSTYRKVRSRGSWDFALVGAAVSVTVRRGVVEEARIVLSGVAPAPWRAVTAEQALVGQRLALATAARAGAAATVGAAPLSGNAYKVALVRGVVEETLLSLA